MKTYKQLISEAMEKNFNIGKFGRDMAAGMIVSPIAGLLSTLTSSGKGKNESPAEQTKDAADQASMNREYQNDINLDRQQQTAQASMDRFKEKPLGTQYKQPNIINAPRKDLSGQGGQRTELV